MILIFVSCFHAPDFISVNHINFLCMWNCGISSFLSGPNLYLLLHFSDQCLCVQWNSSVVKLRLRLIEWKLWPLTFYSLPVDLSDEGQTDRRGAKPLFGAFRPLDAFPPHCKMKSCAREHFLFSTLIEAVSSIKLQSTLYLLWLWRLQVTPWSQCSQCSPHQPRCEFSTFLFVLFISNLKKNQILFLMHIL